MAWPVAAGGNRMNSPTPFLDIRSFVTQEIEESSEAETTIPAMNPFLALYESEDGNSSVTPETEAYVAFLNELYDEEFNDGLSTLIDEAAAIYETQFLNEQESPQTAGYQAEQFLHHHFSPLASETEAMFASVASELNRRGSHVIKENEIEALVDGYRSTVELTPSFEDFLGKLKKAVKKVASKAVDLAKKGISAAAKFGLGPILEKLKALIKPLLKRVIQTAIGKLPAGLQPMARKLSDRLPFLKEFEQGETYAPMFAESWEIGEIQRQFNEGAASLLFAQNEEEQNLEVAKAIAEYQTPERYPLAELDLARARFIENIERLKEGENPAPYIENFVPAILPALRIGVKLIGRRKIVDFLANLMGKLIQKFVGPQYAPALSQAIVDAGLRLIQLETTVQDESTAAPSAVAATVEETVLRVAAAPDYILDNQELLEGFTLEAFEQAAAANLPPVLPDETYRKRPELGEARKLRGAWIMMPRGLRKRYKKFSRKIPVKLIPHTLSGLETLDGDSMEAFLEEQLGVSAGEEVAAALHLYEALPGTSLNEIARLEEAATGLGGAGGHQQLQRLTSEAATLLTGQPDLGRGAGNPMHNPHHPMAGERFYYLEVPGKRLLTIPGPDGRIKPRRATRLRLTLDFPGNEIRIYLFLGEIRSQAFAVKLRRHAHTGVVMTHLGRIASRGLTQALTGGRGLKIIHEAVTPDQWAGALKRLPSLASQVLLERLQEWMLKGVAGYLKQHPEVFIKAAEDTADGVTLSIIFGNPPGFPQLRQALKGKGMPLSGIKMADGAPLVKVHITPGYHHE